MLQIQPLWNLKKRMRTSKGFRNQFEERLGSFLDDRRVAYEYETLVLSYTLEGKYKPDFILPNGIIIEAKGFFRTNAQRTLRAVKKKHPKLDIRLVFYNQNQKVQGSKLKCYEWAVKYKFEFANGSIPEEWITNDSTKNKKKRN